MAERNVIAPENMGSWTVAAFILALLALIAAFIGLYRIGDSFARVEAQVFVLNNKVDMMKQPRQISPAAEPAKPEAATPMAPETPTPPPMQAK